MLVPVDSSRDFHLTLLTCFAYGHCAWTWTGMHFSPERLCGLCAAAYPRMISLGVTALYHSHEAGTLEMLHTHQTKGCELHSTAHVPRLCRTFSIFYLRAWCREPLVCACQRSIEALICTTRQSGRDQTPLEHEHSTLSIVSTGNLENHSPATISLTALMLAPVDLVNSN